jgi:hypothetical protein
MTTTERTDAATDVADVTWDLSHLLDGRDESAVAELLGMPTGWRTRWPAPVAGSRRSTPTRSSPT